MISSSRSRPGETQSLAWLRPWQQLQLKDQAVGEENSLLCHSSQGWGEGATGTGHGGQPRPVAKAAQLGTAGAKGPRLQQTLL